MKKSITCSLVATLGLGACVGLAACNRNSGGSNGPTLSPEEALMSDLLSNTQADEMLCMEAETDINLSMGDAQGSLNMQLAFDMSSGTPMADLYGHILTGQQDSYVVEYIRGEAAYLSEGAWPATANGYNDLADSFRASDGPILEQPDDPIPDFGRENVPLSALQQDSTLSPDLTGGAAFPFAVKLIENVPLLLGATVQQNPGGYVIEFDLVKSLNNIVGRLSDVLDSVSANTTIGDLIGKGYPDEVLKKLFNGIKASEFIEFGNYFLPTDFSGILPDAGDKTLYDYVHELLSSKEFYRELREWAEDALPEKNSLGEVTLGEFITPTDAPDGTFEAYLVTAKSFLQTLKGNVVSGIIMLAMGGTGYGSIDTAKVSIKFDRAKRLTNMDIIVSGLEITMSMSAASFPQFVTWKANGTVAVTFPAQVTLTSLSGMRYYSDETQKGVLELGTTEPAEYMWYIDLGRDLNYQEYKFYMILETYATVESDSVTYHLRGAADGIDLDFTIPMDEIDAQLHQDRDYIISTQLRATHEGQPYSMTLWFQFTEYNDECMLSVIYQARLDNAPLDGSSYGSDTLPEVYLPFARIVKTIA